MACPDENELARFLERALGPDRARDIEDHFGDCDDCRRLVYALAPVEASGPPARGGGALEPGATVGRFEIVRRLGEGAMGIIYEAHDPALRRNVALKVMRVGSSPLYPDARARLLREAQGLARLDHPNVVTVFEVGVEAGEVFIAMELIQGVSLDEWLAERPRTWREVLAVMGAAGRGLAAAHAAGLLHRDVKPQNLMVASDGRVKVVDFGLVCPSEGPTGGPGDEPAAAGDPDRLGEVAPSRVTITGVLVGTPAYSAPEQLAGGELDRRSDVFSFCVTLYEALYGRRPYQADTAAGLLAAMHGAGPVELPPRPRLPARLRQLVRRGLAADPARRLGSMEEILPALGRSRRRAGPVLAAAGVVALAAAAVPALGALRSEAPAPCSASAAEIAAVWGPARKAQVKAALLGTGLPYAADTWARVERTLDDQARRWAATHTRTCKATAVHRTQSPALLDRRMACLDARLFDLDNAAAALTEGSPQAARGALGLVTALEPPESCAALALEGRPAPRDPEVAARVREVAGEVARARATLRAGRIAVALEQAEAAAGAAAATGDRAIEAEALHLLGLVRTEAGELAAARDSLQRAVWLAASAGLHRTEALALSDLALLVNESSPDGHVALTHARQALSVVERAGGDPRLEAEVRYGLARVLVGLDNGQAAEQIARGRALLERVAAAGGDAARVQQADFAQLSAMIELDGEAAIAHLEEALALGREAFGEDHPYVGAILEQMAIQYATNDDLEAAREHARRAAVILAPHPGNDATLRLVEAQLELDRDRRLALYQESVEAAEALHGPSSPAVSAALDRMAETLLDLGRAAEARAPIERAVRIAEATYGPRAVPVMAVLWTAVEVHLQTGDLAAARAGAERARDIAASDRSQHGPIFQAISQLLLGRVLFVEGDFAGALALARAHEGVVREVFAGDPALGGVDFLIAASEWELGRDRPRALRRARAARRLITSVDDPDTNDLHLMDAWLAKH